jgi:hypothetical protein
MLPRLQQLPWRLLVLYHQVRPPAATGQLLLLGVVVLLLLLLLLLLVVVVALLGPYRRIQRQQVPRAGSR